MSLQWTHEQWWDSVRWQRCASALGPTNGLFDLSFTERSITIELFSGERFEYDGRWRQGGSLVGRTDMEQALGCGPGYLDGIEDVWGALRVDYLELGEELNEVYNEVLQLEHGACDIARTIREDLEREVASLSKRRALCVTESAAPVMGATRFIPDEENYVYFLMQGDVVVYVGQSSRVTSRIKTHLKSDKEFDAVWILSCSADELNDVEQKYIEQFDPLYNKR